MAGIDEFGSAMSAAYRAEELQLRQRDLRLQGALVDGRGPIPSSPGTLRTLSWGCAAGAADLLA